MNEKKNMPIPISKRVSQMPKSAIHEMTRLSKEVDDVAFFVMGKTNFRYPGTYKEKQRSKQ